MHSARRSVMSQWVIAATLGALYPGLAWAQDDVTAAPDTDPVTRDQVVGDDGFDEDDFGALDLEALMQIQVTSVVGRAQPLSAMPAAIYVLTAEDIRRSGHRTIAEALRMVPGVTVGQISPSQWAISTRGFASRFANKQLVLIDGRTVYDPLFSGVFWHIQDLLLEDLDRIEVIRGPGATLWGANAVNGVISITTKSAKETQGLYLTGGGGNVYQGFGAIRYGGEINENTHYRVWGKYDNFDSWDNVAGVAEPNAWDIGRGGFRVDWEGGEDLQMTAQGDIYATGHMGSRVRVPLPDSHLTTTTADIQEQYQGGNVLFRIGQSRSDKEGWSFQTYYDGAKTRGGQPEFEVRRHTVDADYRHYVPLGADEEHVLMWGLAYRHTRDQIHDATTTSFDPNSRSVDTFSGFIQDTFTVIPNELVLMAGTKLEHNDHTGFEIQPSGRLSWMPDDRQTVWGAVSRAVRTPSRTADDLTLTTVFGDTGLLAGGAPSGMFVPLQLKGDPDLDSEELLAFEIGYRQRVTETLSFDLATFYNIYDNLITFPTPAGTFGNRGEADTYGLELASTWDVADNWMLSASYSFLEIDFNSPDGNDEEGESPTHQFNIRSYLDITEDVEFNAALYYVDNIPDEGAPSYIRLDLGFTWRPTANVEIAFWAQNLLDDKHLEFGDDLFQAVPLEVPRSFYAQVTLRF